jgi:NO-binding membrane sensor protein with MHYT domain
MRFWRFIDSYEHLDPQLSTSYDPLLVVLSIVIACLAAYVALTVVDRIIKVKNPLLKRKWLITGAIAMGCGIWAMHFIGMLSYTVPISVNYNIPMTIVSAIPAMLGSGIALYVMSRSSINWQQLQIGGLLMAVGIGTMHYSGMEAMRMNAYMYYDLTLFIISILVAHVMATIALYINLL